MTFSSASSSVLRFVHASFAVGLLVAAAACGEGVDGSLGNTDDDAIGGGQEPTDPGAGGGGGGGGGPSGPAPSRCACSTGANVPFGFQGAVPGDVMFPSQEATARTSALVSYYQQWKAAFVKDGCGGAVVESKDAPASPLTVSEAHGYGMLITAMMAGADPEAKVTFDKFVDTYLTHQASSSLMSWRIFDDCSSENQNATDGDLDIAYALLLADRQWGSNCDHGRDYLGMARNILFGINRLNVIRGNYMALGDWVNGDFTSVTRSSDFMPDHLRAFDSVGIVGAQWSNVIDTTYGIFNTIQTQYSPSTGLVPDFIVDANSNPAPAPTTGGGVLEGDRDGTYSFNACRVPLRIGLDYLTTGEPRAKAFLTPMDAFFESASGGDPNGIVAGYGMDGQTTSGFARAGEFRGPAGLAAIVAARNQQWVDAIWNASSTDFTGRYYGDTVQLLAMIAMSGNWWSPNNVTCQ